MMGEREFEDLLRSVSRSFYLTMRYLPAAMRPAISVAYLLARVSDNVADVSSAPPEQRRAVLRLMRAVLSGQADAADLEELFMRLQAPALAGSPSEQVLLRLYGDWLWRLEQLPPEQGTLVRRVLVTIIGAQLEDLEPAVDLSTEEQTLRYCDGVAGCVGVFWTELGFAALGGGFAPPEQRVLMAEAGRRYGRGLQLVNILRDEEEDAARGRRYFAAAERERWCSRAERYLRDGVDYARRLRAFRLRFATLLPALLGLGTLRLLRARQGTERVKLPRRAVYAAMLAAAWRSL